MGTSVEKVTTMYLDNKFNAPNVDGELLAKCEKLETLSCASCGLATLSGFPPLAKLKSLLLNDNRISSGLDALVKCENLTSLSLANNRIASVDDLKPLADELTLNVLEVEQCPLTNAEGYFETIMSMMPTLNTLDGRYEFGNEVDDEDDDEEEEDEDDDEDEDDEDNNDDDDDDDDDDEDDEDEDEDEDVEDDEPGLADLYGAPLEDDESEEDFIEGDASESEDILDDDDEDDDDDDEDEDDEEPSKKARTE